MLIELLQFLVGPQVLVSSFQVMEVEIGIYYGSGKASPCLGVRVRVYKRREFLL